MPTASGKNPGARLRAPQKEINVANDQAVRNVESNWSQALLKNSRVIPRDSIAHDFEIGKDLCHPFGGRRLAALFDVHNRFGSAEDVLNTGEVIEEGRTDLLCGVGSCELGSLGHIGRRGAPDLVLLKTLEF